MQSKRFGFEFAFHASDKHFAIKNIPFSQALPHLAVVFLLSFTLYLWSAPRTVALEDDGLFILAGYFNGIAHPPGYPLYTLLGKSASLVPVSTPAFRAHALSGFFGALSCATLWYISRLLLSCINSAYVAAFAYSVSKAFWSQAIIAEVYTLNVFIFLILLALMLKYVSAADKWKNSLLPLLMAFIYGLGISNHWPLLVLSTPCLILVLWPALPYLLRMLPKLVPFLLLGLMPYVWMVWRSQLQPAISFSGRIDSVNDFWYVFSRKMYVEVDNSRTADWHDKYQFVLFQLKEYIAQFGWLGFCFAGIGFIRQWQIWPRSICWAAVAGFLGNSMVLIALLNFDYDAFHRKLYHVYPLISYAFEAVWLGIGFKTIISIVSAKTGRAVHNTITGYAVGFSVVAVIMISHVRVNYRSGYQWAEQYAAIVLKSLQTNAVLFCDSETSAGPIGYLNLIKKIRPDISLYNSSGLLFDSRLVEPIESDDQDQKEATREFIINSERPVYYFGNMNHPYAEKNYGLFRQVDKNGIQGNVQPIITSEILKFLRHSFYNAETDPWTRSMIKIVQRDFGTVLLYLYLSAANEHVRHQYWRMIEVDVYTFPALVVMLNAMMQRAPGELAKIAWLLEKAEALLYEAESKKEVKDFYLLKARFAAAKKNF
ncbi:MAG: glycosyltransferase family 117 protein [Gammaproteobacteria bacterium]